MNMSFCILILHAEYALLHYLILTLTGHSDSGVENTQQRHRVEVDYAITEGSDGLEQSGKVVRNRF